MENSLFSVLQKMLPMASLPAMYCGWWWSFDLNRSPGHKITVMTLSEFIWEQFGMTCHCFYNWPPYFDRHVFPFFFCLFSLVCFLFQLKSFLKKKRKKTTSHHIKCDQKLYFRTVMFMFLTSKSFLTFWRNKEIKELAAVFDNKIFNCHVIWCCVL